MFESSKLWATSSPTFSIISIYDFAHLLNIEYLICSFSLNNSDHWGWHLDFSPEITWINGPLVQCLPSDVLFICKQINEYCLSHWIFS